MAVAKLYKEADAERSKQRREKIVREKCRREALKQRATREKERLSTLNLITSADELNSEKESEETCTNKRSNKHLEEGIKPESESLLYTERSAATTDGHHQRHFRGY